MALPGDNLVPAPMVQTTNAVTINVRGPDGQATVPAQFAARRWRQQHVREPQPGQHVPGPRLLAAPDPPRRRRSGPVGACWPAACCSCGGCWLRLGHQGEHLAFTLGEQAGRAGGAGAAKEAGDDRRVNHALALMYASERVGQDTHAGHAFLEQVADPARVLLDQPHRVVRLKMVGGDEHLDIGMRGADFLSSDEALVGVSRRHLDIDDRDVGAREFDFPGLEQRVAAKAPGMKGWAFRKLINFMVAQGQKGLPDTGREGGTG